MPNEQMIAPQELREGDRIQNWAGILVDVTVSEVAGGRLTFERADGSTFVTSVPGDERILVRVPRPGLKAVA
jgi:hypothetical protein